VDLGLRGKTAIVTGGASGIGLETARLFAREGARIVVADLDPARVRAAQAELEALGAEASGVETDVRRYTDCERLLGTALDRFGGVEILVASAGITREDFFLRQRPEDWQALVDVNVLGLLHANHVVGAHMVERGRGAIVNLASEAGKLGEKRMAAYSATKGAVIAFSKAFAAEVGRANVRVNAVCPGVTRTPMTAGMSDEIRARAARLYPLGRLGEPADIAAMIAFLASDQTSWVTGQAVSVSGGFGRA
jgi:NAD(P)-dependent dehydrogenase (short-subunit alcohol dehydrogenase family)